MEDMQYDFRVAAVNKAGAGPYSETKSPTKALEPIGISILDFIDTFQESVYK